MKKSEFIDRVAEKAETSRAAATRVVEAIFDATSGTIAEAVKAGSHVGIPGFGKFRSKTRAARKGRNPNTGAEIDIPERMVVAFTPGKGLQDTLAGRPATKRRAGASTAKAPAAKTGAGGGAKRAAAKK
jgi:nucleoid DNA-binding protein